MVEWVRRSLRERKFRKDLKRLEHRERANDLALHIFLTACRGKDDKLDEKRLSELRTERILILIAKKRTKRRLETLRARQWRPDLV